MSTKVEIDEVQERLQHGVRRTVGCGATTGKGQSEVPEARYGCPRAVEQILIPGADGEALDRNRFGEWYLHGGDRRDTSYDEL